MRFNALALACVLALGAPQSSNGGVPGAQDFLCLSVRQQGVVDYAPPNECSFGVNRKRCAKQMLADSVILARLRGGADSVKCTFEVQVEGLEQGDEVFCVGSDGALGSWDTSKAVKLNPTTSGLWWRAAVSSSDDSGFMFLLPFSYYASLRCAVNSCCGIFAFWILQSVKGCLTHSFVILYVCTRMNGYEGGDSSGRYG
jgi:hypothetical protein